jgi:Fur family transcriptional regulator, iron response regulator
MEMRDSRVIGAPGLPRLRKEGRLSGESDPRLIETVTRRLTSVGLRATRPRVALGKLLFGGPHRHINAEQLFREAQSLRYKTSLATVYNTLNQFTQAGLLREIPVEGHRTFFDTRTGPHFHYLNEATGELFDAPENVVDVSCCAATPEGFEVSEIQVVVRLRPIGARPAHKIDAAVGVAATES